MVVSKPFCFHLYHTKYKTRERKGCERGATRNFLHSFSLSGTPVIQSCWVRSVAIPLSHDVFRGNGDLAIDFSRHTRTLVGKFARVTDPKSEEFEVGNGKTYLHPKQSPISFSRSVNILVRMVVHFGVHSLGPLRANLWSMERHTGWSIAVECLSCWRASTGCITDSIRRSRSAPKQMCICMEWVCMHWASTF